MTTTDENEPPKIRVIWEELSCLSAHDGGGLEVVAADVKILYKEKEFFLAETTLFQRSWCENLFVFVLTPPGQLTI